LLKGAGQFRTGQQANAWSARRCLKRLERLSIQVKKLLHLACGLTALY
jgi:hypothetical protein